MGAILAITVLLTGCSFPGTNKNKMEFPGSTLAGQVTAVEEKAVTLALGFIMEPQSGADLPDDDITTPEETAEPSAEPTDDGGVSAEPPAVTDESDALDKQNNPEETAEPNDGGDADAPAGETDQKDNTARGVNTSGVETFTQGTSTALLTIGDEGVLFKADGATNAALADIKVGSILSVDMDTDGKIVRIVIKEVPTVIVSGDVNYFAANEVSKDTQFSDGVIDSTGMDEAAILAYNDAELGIDGVTINRTSDNSTGGEGAGLYGVGSAVIASNATAFIRRSTIETQAKGAAGIFSYGEARVYVSDTEINTGMDDSAGAQSSLGKLSAWDLTVETSGANSPAAGAVNGGKTILEGGLYTTNAQGSPVFYSAGTLAAKGITATGNADAAAVLCGRNALYIFDGDISAAMSSEDGYAIGAYDYDGDRQSTDKGEIQLVGGNLTSAAGGFYITNTNVKIFVSGVDISLAEGAYFLKCVGNETEGMGKAGGNGGKCVFTASAQEITGDVIWDAISSLSLYFDDESTFTGAVLKAGEGEGEGFCDMYIGEGSKWVVTGDSVLTNLYCEGEIVDADGKAVAIKDESGKTLKKGSSEFTVTVSSFDDSADMSGAVKGSSWEDYQAKRPSGM